MADPLGILALLIVAAGPSDPADFVWADDVANPVQQVSFQENMADRPSSLPSDVEASDDGMVFASDIPGDDGKVVLGGFQDESPFTDEPLPAPPHPAGQAPSTLPGTFSEQNGLPPEHLLFDTQAEVTYGDDSFTEACQRTDRHGGSLLEKIVYDGWISQGYTLNANGPRNNLNFPVGFNNQSNQYQMNQIYVLLEKPVDRSGCSWDIGGQVDLLFGTDATFATSRGLETHEDFSDRWNLDRYGLAMPQLYMEVFAPWGNGLSLKLGHFYSLVGYETVPAAENFFYSHSYALQYGEPITHTGFVASKQLGRMTFHAGMTRGWDNWSDNNNDSSFIAGINFTSEDGRTSIAYGFVGGREQDDPPRNTNFRSMFSLVVQHQLDERFRYVAQYDHGFDEFGAARGTRDADWFGVNQYLFYRINCKCDFGVRYEWFRDEDATRILTRQPGDYFEATAGFNWRPEEHITVRPEFRVDWVDNGNFRPFVDGRRRDQITLACDVIVRF
ncbi:MAG: porin [Thermoguttaceae bacterium]